MSESDSPQTVEMPQPVAWAVEFPGDDEPFFLAFREARAIDEAGGGGKVVPLYRSPTLTDAEREAIEDASGRYVEGLTPKAGHYAATLRGLLERTQTVR